MKIATSLIICLFLCLHISAQNLALGQWRSLLPYTTGKYVTQTPDEVWYAADMSIVRFDKVDISTRYLDRVGGLSDVNIAVMEYNAENEVVVVAYANSNIDLVSPDGKNIQNMDDIKRKIDLQGDKSIYHIYFLEDNAYLSTGFGIVKLNLTRREIDFTTFTGIKVNTLTSQDGQFYAATDEGIYTAPISGVNLQDFGNWQRLTTTQGLLDDYSTNVVHSHNNTLYADVNDSLFILANNTREYVLHHEDYFIRYLRSGSDKLIVNTRKNIDYGQEIYLVEDNSGNISTPLPFGCLSGDGLSAVEDEQNRLWVGDLGKGFRMFNIASGNCSNMTFNSPYSINNAGMAVDEDGLLWVTSGTIAAGWQYGFNPGGFASYDHGEWTLYNQFTTPELSGMIDQVDILIHPDDRRVFVSSFIRGLTVFDGQNFTIYNTTNSPLATPSGDTPGNCRVPGIALDAQGNLWMSNHGVPNPIAMLKADGTWKTFPVAGTNSLVLPAIDPSSNKWFTTSTNGLVVFNEGDDIDNNADNQIRYINPSNSALPTDVVYDVEVDLDGDVWVGTGEGVVIFECGNNVFNASQCPGDRRIVERADGNNAYLLEADNVRCIAVDGANRKWFGTTNGVFLTSPDGREELLHFTTDNSPLFSNTINSIAIDPTTGEVYIGTSVGIISYMGDATTGDRTHRADVFAFPNPVRPDYKGPIAIRGLAQDATVKITDISGTLIYETTANGGQAIWDGKDYNGREASSGVYLVFSANEANLQNPDGFVTKIMVVR